MPTSTTTPPATPATPSAPPKVHEHFGHRARTSYGRVNGRIAQAVTRGVSTMTCAYLFAALALVGLPGAVGQGVLGVVQWTAQTFIQLVFLSILAVGQRVAADAADARAEATFRDAESLLAQQTRTRQVVDAISTEIAALTAYARGPLRSGLVDLREKPTSPPPDPGQ